MTSPYPPYVDDIGYGLQVPAIPAACDECMLMSFFVAADHDAMQATVDKFLNQPNGGAISYYVLGGSAILTYSFTKRHYSMVQQIGYLSDYECAFWIPLFARTNDGSEPDRITFWIPYLFISWPEGMATGREIWGFRKEIGQISMPLDAKSDATFSTVATIFDPLSNETKGRDETVVRVRKEGELGPFAETIKDIADLAKLLVQFWGKGASELPVSRLGLAVDVVKTMLAGKLPIVNLKQFRDATDSTRACYQAIIESTCTPSKVISGGLLDGDFVLDASSFASHNIVKDLGLAGSTGIPVEFAIWIKMNFSADPGREVWKA
jgi:hypothetical protein